jgi:hypothetical protein
MALAYHCQDHVSEHQDAVAEDDKRRQEETGIIDGDR